MIGWYWLINEAAKIHPNRFLIISFGELVSKDEKTMGSLSNFLEIPMERFVNGLVRENKETNHISQSEYTPLSQEKLHSVLDQIPHMAEYCRK